MTSDPYFVVPDWPAPPKVRAVSTTRLGGVSSPPYDTMNLGTGSGDDPDAVASNRARVREALGLPAEPAWLRQVHGVEVVDAAEGRERAADASVARGGGAVCAVLTADCLPVLLCDRGGEAVGAAHAGWRGLAGGVVEATIDALGVPGDRLIAWLGPAIGPDVYEVGPEVRETFVAHDPDMAGAFRASGNGRWLADLYALARRTLARAGITSVYGGGRCTYTERDWFYSARRDGAATGRMATLIWIEP